MLRLFSFQKTTVPIFLFNETQYCSKHLPEVMILWQVDEYMSRTENAVMFYSKAVRLLAFLQVEAPSLILNPPFSLTNSDRYRLQNYIDVLNNRQSVSKSQMMALLKCEDQHCSP